MAKIGTAHVEIKPVLDEEALHAIAQRIEEAVAAGVARGLAAQKKSNTIVVNVAADADHAAGKIAEAVAFNQRR